MILNLSNSLNEYYSTTRSCSLDEAYLDITNYIQKNGGNPQEIVLEMRNKIYEKTKLTASAGIGVNTLISKVCSDRNKPNGQFMVDKTPDAILSFISELPIRKVPGIGKVMERLLNALGIHTCQDIV